MDPALVHHQTSSTWRRSRPVFHEFLLQLHRLWDAPSSMNFSSSYITFGMLWL